jgi:hypothetical protein
MALANVTRQNGNRGDVPQSMFSQKTLHRPHISHKKTLQDRFLYAVVPQKRIFWLNSRITWQIPQKTCFSNRLVRYEHVYSMTPLTRTTCVLHSLTVLSLFDSTDFIMKFVVTKLRNAIFKCWPVFWGVFLLCTAILSFTFRLIGIRFLQISCFSGEVNHMLSWLDHSYSQVRRMNSNVHHPLPQPHTSACCSFDCKLHRLAWSH